MKCEQCNFHERYQHPKTNKVYKLCAKCGWESLVKLLGFADDKTKSDQRKVDEVIVGINNL